MAFVETAILKLIDKSSKQARKINRELEKLHKTSERLEKSFGKINSASFARAQSQARALNSTLLRLLATKNRLNTPINLRVTGGRAANSLDTLNNRLEKLRATKTRPVIDTSSINNAIKRARLLNTTLNAASRVRAPVITNAPVRRPQRDFIGGNQTRITQTENLRVMIDERSFNPMQRILSNFAQNIGFQIAHAIGRATVEGVKTTDIADSRVTSLGANQTEVDKAASQLSSDFPVLSPANMRSLLGELLPQTENNVPLATELAKQLAPLAQLGVTFCMDRYPCKATIEWMFSILLNVIVCGQTCITNCQLMNFWCQHYTASWIFARRSSLYPRASSPK